MVENKLPSEIADLIAKYIDSLEELEVLLLLRSNNTRTWSAEQVNDTIRSSVVSIMTRLETMTSQGFLVRDPTGLYQYAPRNQMLAASADILADAYRDRRHKVIEAIFSKPQRNIQSFSEAFRFRGGKSDG